MPGSNSQLGSVWSILQHLNALRTGQNVLFFSREAYKTMHLPCQPEPDFNLCRQWILAKTGEKTGMLASFFDSGQPDASGQQRLAHLLQLWYRVQLPRLPARNLRFPRCFCLSSDIGNVSFDPTLGRFGEQLIPAPDFSGSLFDTSELSLSGHSDSAGDDFLTNDSDRPLMGPVPPSAPWHMTTSIPFDPQDDTVKNTKSLPNLRSLFVFKPISTRRPPTRRMVTLSASSAS
jgi:hypothetical protein